MHRIATGLCALVALVVIVLVVGFLVEKPAIADLDPKACSSQTQVLTARAERVRMVIPRNWCGSDHPGYPGVLVSITPMVRNAPHAEILVTAEPFTRDLYCSWSTLCRNQTTSSAKYACALREKLAAARMKVGPAQLGPKENEAAGVPSMWFEFEDGKRFLRQAVAVTGDRAISLVLSASSVDARSTHVRAFDQALRTLQVLSAAESVAPVGAVDAGVVATDAGSGSDAPVSRVTPIGPCPR